MTTLLEWYDDVFRTEYPYEYATITKDFSQRRFWFAQLHTSHDEIHCHAGNLRKPVWRDDVLALELTLEPVQVGDTIIVAPYRGPQGVKAYRWALVRHAQEAFEETEEWQSLQESSNP